MMDELIKKFPAQLKEALEIGANAKINAPKTNIHNIFVAGLGGSGIGANFVSEFIKSECKVPFTIGKSYDIPASVDQHTLAIASSYSGNTEETLASFYAMEKTGAKIVVISSGGKLIQLAQEKSYDYIQLPDNWPSPRACLGYSMVQQLFILQKLDLISDTFISHLKASTELLNFDQEEIGKLAFEIAQQLHDKIPVIYTTDRMESAAIRLRQQINENSKMLCWHHVIPEMNHNELVGWSQQNKSLAVVYLRNEDDLKKNKVRIEINKKIIAKYTDTIIEVFSKGNSLIEKAIYFVHLADWISWHLSVLNKVDASEIKVIDYLKSELGKV
jgi:glucose/mannose-6-phosphate isomerase